MHFLLIIFVLALFYPSLKNYIDNVALIVLGAIILIITIILFSIFPEAMVLIFSIGIIFYAFDAITSCIKEIKYKNKIKDIENFKINGGEYLISKFRDLFKYNYCILIISKNKIRKNEYIVSKNNLKIIFYLNDINKISIRGTIEGVKINENFNSSINSYEQIRIREDVAIQELQKTINEFIEFFEKKINIFLDREFFSLKGEEIIVHDMNYKNAHKISINIKYINNKNFKLKTNSKNYSLRLAEYDLKNSENLFYINFDKNNKKILAHKYTDNGKLILEISYEKWIYYRINKNIIFVS